MRLDRCARVASLQPLHNLSPTATQRTKISARLLSRSEAVAGAAVVAMRSPDCERDKSKVSGHQSAVLRAMAWNMTKNEIMRSSAKNLRM